MCRQIEEITKIDPGIDIVEVLPGAEYPVGASGEESPRKRQDDEQPRIDTLSQDSAPTSQRPRLVACGYAVARF